MLFVIIFAFSAGLQADEWDDDSEVINSRQTYEDEYGDEYGDEYDDYHGDEYGDEEKNVQSPDVEIYVTSWCSYSRKAIDFLNTHNIEYSAYDVEKDMDAAERKEELAPDSGVPVAVINGKTIIGFREETYIKALQSGR